MSSRPASRTPSRSVSSGSFPPSRRRSTTTTNTTVPELSPEEEEKAALVTAACDERNLDALIRLATTRLGLVSDPLRRAAWPLLLGCTDRTGGRHADKDAHKDSPNPPHAPHLQGQTQTSWKDLPEHSDEGQVALDVNRAFVYYPKNESEKQLDRRKQQLSDVIIHVLRLHPSLCYFQGYHDIAQVFLLVLGPDDAPDAVARLSMLRIRDFMLSKLDPAMSHLELLRPIMAAADPILYQHLPKHRPTFALAGTITLFAHIIQEYRDIARLFDFFLAHHTVIPIYFFAAIVLSRRDEILDIDRDDEDIMSAILGKLPDPFDVEFHIARAVELYERLPPASLQSWEWWRISSSSVLKTSPTPALLAHTPTQAGEALLKRQEAEIRLHVAVEKAALRAKLLKRRLWMYRRQSGVVLAVAVGLYALWLGRGTALAAWPGLAALGPAGEALRKKVFAVAFWR